MTPTQSVVKPIKPGDLVDVVWFKKDLRLHDHEALTQATQKRPTLLLYVWEPELWAQPDASYCHFLFLKDCLTDLCDEASRLGQSPYWLPL